MARRMSCALSINAVKGRRKTVTRRHVDSWSMLEVGDHLTLIEKGMGLKAGQKQVVLAEVEVIDVGMDRLTDITEEEIKREAVWEWHGPQEWALEWVMAQGYKFDGMGTVWTPDGERQEMRFKYEGWPYMLGHIWCRRIEWKYL